MQQDFANLLESLKETRNKVLILGKDSIKYGWQFLLKAKGKVVAQGSLLLQP